MLAHDELYGLYKQATLGVCPSTAKPSLLQFTARAKWDAWSRLESMSSQDAMRAYIALVNQITTDPPSQQSNQKQSSSSFAVRVSAPIDTREEILDKDKTCFQWAEEGNLERVRDELKMGANVNATDEMVSFFRLILRE